MLLRRSCLHFMLCAFSLFHWGTNRTKSLTFVFTKRLRAPARRWIFWIFSALSLGVGGGRHLEVVCVHPEKAIMLCKANIIGDYKMYGQIQAAASPQEAKALRRSVSPFVPARWDALVCEVARAVCVQKALGVPELHARLLETGERVIAEMTRND